MEAPRAKPITTLKRAAAYIAALPEAEREAEPWLSVSGALERAATEGRGWMMLARLQLSQVIHGTTDIGKRPKPIPNRQERGRKSLRAKRAAWKAKQRPDH